MSNTDEIFDYVMNSPENTNPAVLRGMLNNIGGGGGTFYSGNITPTERLASWSFFAPGCNHFAIMPAENDPITGTGYAFIWCVLAIVKPDSSVRFGGVASNTAGSSMTNFYSVSIGGDVSYDENNFTVSWTLDPSATTARLFQPGIKYAWAAWKDE